MFVPPRDREPALVPVEKANGHKSVLFGLPVVDDWGRPLGKVGIRWSLRHGVQSGLLYDEPEGRDDYRIR